MIKIQTAIVITPLILLASCAGDNANNQVFEQESNKTQNNTHIVQDDPVEMPLQQPIKFNKSHEHNESAQNEADDATPIVVESIDSDYADGVDTPASSGSFEDDAIYEEPVQKVALSNEESFGVIRWEAPEGMHYASAEIIISNTNGETVKRNFSPGEPIALQADLPDGVYNWESVVTPEVNSQARKEMDAVRLLGDQQAEKELITRLRAEGSLPTDKQARENRQSGNFIVRDGIVSPSYVDNPSGAKGG